MSKPQEPGIYNEEHIAVDMSKIEIQTNSIGRGLYLLMAFHVQFPTPIAHCFYRYEGDKSIRILHIFVMQALRKNHIAQLILKYLSTGDLMVLKTNVLNEFSRGTFVRYGFVWEPVVGEWVAAPKSIPSGQKINVVDPDLKDWVIQHTFDTGLMLECNWINYTKLESKSYYDATTALVKLLETCESGERFRLREAKNCDGKIELDHDYAVQSYSEEHQCWRRDTRGHCGSKSNAAFSLFDELSRKYPRLPWRILCSFKTSAGGVRQTRVIKQHDPTPTPEDQEKKEWTIEQYAPESGWQVFQTLLPCSEKDANHQLNALRSDAESGPVSLFRLVPTSIPEDEKREWTIEWTQAGEPKWLVYTYLNPCAEDAAKIELEKLKSNLPDASFRLVPTLPNTEEPREWVLEWSTDQQHWTETLRTKAISRKKAEAVLNHIRSTGYPGYYRFQP